MILKFILPALAAAGVALAAVEVAQSERSVPPNAPPAAMPESPYGNAVAGVGLVEANTENISLGSQAAGVIARVFVQVGDRVRAGEPLFQLDDRSLQAELALKRAAVAAAAVAQGNTAFDLKIAEELMDKNVETANDLEEKRFADRKAVAALAQARADERLTEMNLEVLTIRSPVGGEILQLKVHPGEFAPEAASVAAQPAVLLGNLAPLNVRAEIDENDAWKIKAGAAATGFIRGKAETGIPLTFVRFEPYVVPKLSLTGSGTERTDTRVLQVIFSVGTTAVPVYPGQQMDVYVKISLRTRFVRQSATAGTQAP
jgi:multidrug efflux pump subunit AcrA (membrane-fusion protein)